MGSHIHTLGLMDLDKVDLRTALKAGAWDRTDQDYSDSVQELLEYGADSELLDVAGVRGHMWAQDGMVFVHFDKMHDALDRDELDLRTLLKGRPGAVEVIVSAFTRIHYGRERRKRTIEPSVKLPVYLPDPFMVNSKLRPVLRVGDLLIEFSSREEKVQIGGHWSEIDVYGQLSDETSVFTVYGLRVDATSIVGSLVEAAHRVLHAISVDLETYKRDGIDGEYLVNMAAGVWASTSKADLIPALAETHNLLLALND